MNMELLQLREAYPVEPAEVYDENLHDVNAIIMDLCGALGDCQAFEFRISGFGDARWPVDVTTDLATVLEQLPNALSACKSREPFAINLFEQGVQRRLGFTPEGGAYNATCVSYTSWTPSPESERIQCDELCAILLGLGQKFVTSVSKLLPITSGHPWFAAYARFFDT